MSLTSVKGLGYGGAAGQQLNMVLQELQSLATTVLNGAAAGAAIALPNIEPTDTIQSVIMYAAGVPSDVTAEASAIDRRATGTLTLSGVVAGDTANVNGRIFTCVAKTITPSNAGELGPREFLLGANDTATAANLAQTINDYGDPLFTASSNAAVVTIRAVALGTGGNAITLGTTTHFTRSGATLAGGTATNAIKLSTTNSTGNKLVVSWMKKPAAAV